MSKKIRNQDNISDQEQVKRNIKVGKNLGIAGKRILEVVPQFNRVPTENIVSGENGSFVVLGRDRPGNEYSGTGGKGATEAARVDIIAGLNSSKETKEGRRYNPNFATDAARIYVSQNAHIDSYMMLAEVPMESGDNTSAIGLKADAIRVHARRDIKIVTGNARTEGGQGELLSNGGTNEVPGTISLIAGNNTSEELSQSRSLFDMSKVLRLRVNKLQPIPKGDNLAECLGEIVSAIHNLSSIVGDNTAMIQKIDANLVAHAHVTPAGVTIPGSTYSPGSALIQSQAAASMDSRQKFNLNLQGLKVNYLNNDGDPKVGGLYINSKHVFTT